LDASSIVSGLGKETPDRIASVTLETVFLGALARIAASEAQHLGLFTQVSAELRHRCAGGSPAPLRIADTVR
jgi:hypothetical protein